MAFTQGMFWAFLAVTLMLWLFCAPWWAKRVIIVASVIFYGFWFPPHLAIFAVTGAVAYLAARTTHRSGSLAYMAAAICICVCVLAYLKYCDFFIDNAAAVTRALGIGPVSIDHLDILLPAGISFYTFHCISYMIDVRRGKVQPERGVADFCVYLLFFPQLVAGPITRAGDFLPQLAQKRLPSAGDLRVSAFRILRGLFLKMVIADNIAPFVQSTFGADPHSLDPGTLWVGVIGFAVQIFADFAGYSDIAIGIGRLFGLHLPENFLDPYFARGIEDFWRRWHVSLSSWFRDYVYIPLGGNRGSPARTGLHVMAVFLLSGLWHGANVTFLLWGFLHGMAVLFERGLYRVPAISRARTWIPFRAAEHLVTVLLVAVLWVPFRSPSIGHTLGMWDGMFTGALAAMAAALLGSIHTPALASFGLAMFAAFLLNRIWRRWSGELSDGTYQDVECAVYFFFVLSLPGPSGDFIYFQF